MTAPVRELFAEPDLDLDLGEPEVSTGRSVVEWVCVVAGAVLVALVIKTFVIQSFYIPSGSMEPTLYEDDRILVDKLSFRVRDVRTGDIVVFERPPGLIGDGHDHLIKRVIALAGQRVTIDGGQVSVDGRPVAEPYLAAGTLTAPIDDPAKTWKVACTPAEPCVVPAGAVWVMGDNRSASKDSRWFGPVTEKSIVGRAVVKIWPMSRLGGL